MRYEEQITIHNGKDDSRKEEFESISSRRKKKSNKLIAVLKEDTFIINNSFIHLSFLPSPLPSQVIFKFKNYSKNI